MSVRFLVVYNSNFIQIRFLDPYLNKKNHRHELMIRFNADLQNLSLFLDNVT